LTDGRWTPDAAPQHKLTLGLWPGELKTWKSTLDHWHCMFSIYIYYL